MRALYAAEDPTTMKMSVLQFTDDLLQPTEDDNTKWLKAWRYSSWNHPKYGKVEITPEIGEAFRQNFDEGNLRRAHLVNYDHHEDAAKGGKAGGVIEAIDPRDDGIWYKVKFTDTALEEIKQGEWHYVSPEFDDYWEDPETGAVFEYMPFDLALTNTPFFKGQAPLNFSELKLDEGEKREHKTFSHDELPDSAFLFIESGGKKDADGKTSPRSLRHLPVKTASGSIDEGLLNNAISRLSQKATGTVGGESWLSDSLRSKLLSKARGLKSNGGKPKGGSEVDELLMKFAEKLGVTIEEDDSEDAILAKAESLNETLEPLRQTKEDGERARTFREAFPKEYERIKKLEAASIETEAKTFAEGYSRFTIRDSDGSEYKSILGFSELVKEKIAKAHRKLSEHDFGHKDLRELLDLIGDKGIVDYSEHGSSRSEGGKEFSEEPREAFLQAIKDVMENDELDYEAAMSQAAVKYPKLYENYVRAIPQR